MENIVQKGKYLGKFGTATREKWNVILSKFCVSYNAKCILIKDAILNQMQHNKSTFKVVSSFIFTIYICSQLLLFSFVERARTRINRSKS